jgi:phage terminase large subunit-like protein
MGLPRKNGKSTLASVFGGYMLGFDDEGPEVYAAAAAKHQAGVVFGETKRMVIQSPALNAKMGGIFRVRQYQIESPQNQGIFRVLSSDAPLQHGLNPSANIIDEYHAHKSADLYEALTSGGAARENPLTLTITTAGRDEGSPLGLLYSEALKLPDVERRGHLTIARDEDAGFLLYWYGATDDDDLDDPRVWMDVNPASWVTEEYLRRELAKPTTRRESWNQLHLNVWSRVVAGAFPRGAWKRTADPALMACQDTPRCADGTCLRGFDPSLPLVVAVDASYRRDSTSVTMAQRINGQTRTRTKIWQNPYPPGHSLSAFWVTPKIEVQDHLRMLRAEFPEPAIEIDGDVMPGPAFAYDPAYWQTEAGELEGEGLAMVKITQSDLNMVPASETLYRLVVDTLPDGRPMLVQDGDPQVAQQIANSIADAKGGGRWRLSKPAGSKRKIDAAISNAIAVWLAQRPPPEPTPKRDRTLRTYNARDRRWRAVAQRR